MSIPLPTHACDLSILPHAADRSSTDCHGWCFGLPPGITPERWPLDPANGYPLQHGFTLLLPEEYRCHGPELVAVSFFASPMDLNDGAPIVKAPMISEAMSAAAAPIDPDLLPFWQSERQHAHPQLHRMTDILGIAYAAILLTQTEFDGPLCQPPPLTPNQYRQRLAPPTWLKDGSAKAYWASEGHMQFVRDALAAQPAAELAENRALRWTVRAHDPNAGRKPRDEFVHAATDYIQPMYQSTNAAGQVEYKEHEWTADHQPNHIGGTMRPVQAVPECSPYYVEFEEQMGGYNFGSGNAQLDLLEWRFDWACD